MDETYLSAFHAVMGTLMLTLGAIALTAPKRRNGRHGRVGEVYFWVMATTLSTGLVIGIVTEPGTWTLFEIVTPPTFALGLVGYLAAKRRPRAMLGRPWLVWHINGMGGSYIGAVTAAGFQIVPRLLEPNLAVNTAIWVVPTVVGSVLIAHATQRWMSRHHPAPARIAQPSR